MTKSMTRTLLLVIFSYVLFTPAVFGQKTIIKGKLTEKGTGEPVTFANIYFKGTPFGTISDTSGLFSLSIDSEKITEDSLVITHLSYVKAVVPFQKNESQTLDIQIEGKFMQLNEVTILPGENRAWGILRKVIANKKINNPEKKTNYYCEEYSKIRFDLNHFSDKIKKNILVKPFDFIWENVDTTENGVTYLPLLLVEKVIDHYYQSSPRDARDQVKALNTVGLPGRKMLEFVDDLYLAPNIYENYVVILEKNFPSPINDNYKQNYRFYVLDSIPNDTGKTFHIVFKPKHKRGLAFTGEMTIESPSYAVKEIQLQFDIMANVNFVRSYLITQKYAPVDGPHWMMTESNVLGDFTVMENFSNMTGFFGRKRSVYRDYHVDSVITEEVFKGTEIVVETDSARIRDEAYWEAHRSDTLSDQEAGIVAMIDRLEADPKFILRKNIIQGIVTGYAPLGKLELGNLYTFYSYNEVEHSRVKLGLRTSDKWEIPFSASAFGAYGTRDQRWKYGGDLVYTFGKEKKPPKRIGISYRNDMIQLGRSFNQIVLDHIVSSFVQIGSDDASRNYHRDFQIFAENHWIPGLVTRINYFNQSISRPFDQLFEVVEPDGTMGSKDAFQTAGIGFTLKYSWQYPDIKGSFYDKKDLRNSFRKFPDLALQWQYADRETFNSDFDYQKVRASLRQQVRMKKFGFFKYYVEAGKTFGTVPYTHLETPFANPLVFMDDYAFNLMNFLEYAADEYVSFNLQHHFDGLILDRFPLINKLKWRSFIFGRAYFGRLSPENNQAVYLFPEQLEPITEPYYEVGFGFENIFKIARMNFIWRITDNEKEGVYRFLVKPSFSFAF